MTTTTAELIAAIGILCLAVIPLAIAIHLAERKDKERSRKMLGKGKSIRFR